ncbi:nitroreductase family protein [Paenibacillus sp. CGMCC 1.16610]|uniref:Nitroreductase family protein n=1 Tax=Paenibacillus anseongense TaxID=2682845 RepID=A0ABW9UE91_9BACL|nr:MULTISPECIES: nitroreductase family protein [Paenibacillus]MBA2937657.1 nitroreductase family protein [Paenibacillus sp. CGMCC 1.16610]MVQ36715.1 nitroreductase family protein [Paenibacillus anseongense]
MSDFSTIVKERRSANKFIPNIEIPNEDLTDILNTVKFAPSAFNLQHAHYIIVKDPAIKEEVYQAAYKQYKVQTASAVILVLGNLDAYKDAARLNEGLLQLGVISKQEYDMTVEDVTNFYENRGDGFKRDEAIRNASLSAQLFMLAAKEKGWDTCPMIGFDAEMMRQILHIPDNYVPALLLTIGKEDLEKRRPRGYRKPVGEFTSFDRF